MSDDPTSAPTAVVLVSGGLDSCVTAALAALEHRMAFLHLNYGQRTERRELQSFSGLAEHYGVKHRLITDVSFMRQIGGSSLVDEAMDIPNGSAQDENPNTYVPFRNANILGIAVAWAETLGCSDIFIGAHAAESIYPDCRPEFFAAFNNLIETGTRPETKIQVKTPLIALDKQAIVRRGVGLEAPLHLTWSCYEREDLACGRCHSCRLRQAGFERAGIEDPVQYA
jgi:7-cyano-7-deazaguanine synthase